MSLLLYTAANKKYEHFTPLYIYFGLSSNADTYVEVGLEDANSYIDKNKEVIRILRNKFGDRFRISTVDFEGILPGAVRFLSKPDLANKCDYVYIGDIDILILDSNIKNLHLENMKNNEIPFSNIVRRAEATEGNHFRLSGLHFAPTDVQYPIPDIDEKYYAKQNSIYGADEHLLYKIMKKKGYTLPTDLDYRPEHGIHLRNGFHPFGRRHGFFGPKLSFEEIRNGKQQIAWSGIEKETYRKLYLQKIKNKTFQELFFHLDIKSKNLLLILENICRNRAEEFEREAYQYIITKYINTELIKRKISGTFIGYIYRKLV